MIHTNIIYSDLKVEYNLLRAVVEVQQALNPLVGLDDMKVGGLVRSGDQLRPQS